MRSVGESTRPRTLTSTLRGGRSLSPARRGRSDDQPPRSLSPIFTLRGCWLMFPHESRGPGRLSGGELDQRAVGPVQRLAVGAGHLEQADAGADTGVEVAALVGEHPGEELAL